jgi:LDH2 family malate/lactate/ureidoglycolate dehydrogenase
MQPGLLGNEEVFRRNVTAYGEAVRSARPVPGAEHLLVAEQPGLHQHDDEAESGEVGRDRVRARHVRSARPVPGGEPVRMPFDRSRAARARRLADDAIEIPDCRAARAASAR